MVTIPVRIILQGLIALVPQNGTDGATMTALVVNAMNTQNVDCYAQHKPVLEFPTSGQDCTAAADVCHPTTGPLCSCDLRNQEISLLPAQVGRGALALDKTPSRAVPFDNTTAGNFAYVANLSALGYTLDPVFLSHDVSTVLPTALAARFQFPFDTAGACTLATRHDDGADYVFAANLRPLHTDEEPQRDKMSQSIAESVEATVAMNLDSGDHLTLRLSPFPGQVGTVHDFILPVNIGEVQIHLSNDREDHMDFMLKHDKLCDDGVGRDFAFFYDLVQNKPSSWSARPVPHVKFAGMKSASDLYPLVDEKVCRHTKGKAPLSRPICPMSSFNGQ